MVENLKTTTNSYISVNIRSQVSTWICLYQEQEW